MNTVKVIYWQNEGGEYVFAASGNTPPQGEEIPESLWKALWKAKTAMYRANTAIEEYLKLS